MKWAKKNQKSRTLACSRLNKATWLAGSNKPLAVATHVDGAEPSGSALPVRLQLSFIHSHSDTVANLKADEASFLFLSTSDKPPQLEGSSPFVCDPRHRTSRPRRGGAACRSPPPISESRSVNISQTLSRLSARETEPFFFSSSKRRNLCCAGVIRNPPSEDSFTCSFGTAGFFFFLEKNKKVKRKSA